MFLKNKSGCTLDLYSIFKPLLFRLNPETAHDATHFLLRGVQVVPFSNNFIASIYSYTSSRFSQSLWSFDFKNPVGLAAGFDKNASVCDGMSALGFGFLELGSVTHCKSDGNSRPRLFRLVDDKALINRMGLNNEGPYQFLRNYKLSRTTIPKLINIAKTNDPAILGDEAIDDMVNCYNALGDIQTVVVFNLSCPNTEDGRTFEDPEAIVTLLDKLKHHQEKKQFNQPFLLKFSNDISLDILARLIKVGLEKGASGFVIGNTSVSREGLKESQESLNSIGRGGLSGDPVYRRALERVRKAYQITQGQVPIIGVGGISNSEQAVEMVRNGASLIELYTALVYQGPSVVHDILEGLEKHLLKEGIMTISDLVGVDVV
jgi:dihydroorotate dehydrogenase